MEFREIELTVKRVLTEHSIKAEGIKDVIVKDFIDYREGRYPNSYDLQENIVMQLADDRGIFPEDGDEIVLTMFEELNIEPTSAYD